MLREASPSRNDDRPCLPVSRRRRGASSSPGPRLKKCASVWTAGEALLGSLHRVARRDLRARNRPTLNDSEDSRTQSILQRRPTAAKLFRIRRSTRAKRAAKKIFRNSRRVASSWRRSSSQRQSRGRARSRVFPATLPISATVRGCGSSLERVRPQSPPTCSTAAAPLSASLLRRSQALLHRKPARIPARAGGSRHGAARLRERK